MAKVAFLDGLGDRPESFQPPGDGRELLRAERCRPGGAFRLSAKVVIFPAARAREDLPLFMLFGWYLAVMLYEDSSVT